MEDAFDERSVVELYGFFEQPATSTARVSIRRSFIFLYSQSSKVGERSVETGQLLRLSCPEDL
jgi:hypothetical protein